jgi:CRISPR system Cascade subunit CasA
MTASFDLLECPWIPCTLRDGTPVELGLRDTLIRAHELGELHGESPLVTASLHRLLLAVLHRILNGPRDWMAWDGIWNRGRWDERQVDAYLERWHHRFDLFDPGRPFYQAPDERVEEPRAINRLIHEMAHGNNATLFDHHLEEERPPLRPAEAARALVAIQSFGLGGFGMGRLSHTHAPCTGGIVFLVQGDTLFETLALNLLRYPDETLPGRAEEGDRPIWEMDDPFTPERSVPLGYLDYLTWQNRRILFFPETVDGKTVVRGMTEAPALRLKKDILDPMQHYADRGRGGPRPLGFREGRALWRDSAALYELDTEGFRPPRTFDWLAELVYEDCLPRHETRRYLGLGLAIAKGRAAKVAFYRSERMPLPLQYLQDESLVARLRESLEMAEAVARQLWGAARTLASLILSPETDMEAGRAPAREDLDRLTGQWAVERHYWVELETPFLETMEALPEDAGTALSNWQRTLKRAAWDAFDHVTDQPSRDPHKLKAVVRSRGQLAAGLGKVLPSQKSGNVNSTIV